MLYYRGMDVVKDCPLLRECRFFNDIIEDMPSVSEALKGEYCLGDHLGCARFLVYMEIGKKNLPDDVFPNQSDKAVEVVRRFRIYGARH